MKNYKVRPEHIIDLVGKVAASFNAWQLEYEHLPANMKVEYMHYMSDMLDGLINTAYPINKKETSTDEVGKESVKAALNKGYEAKEKAMKECRLPVDSANTKALKAAFENLVNKKNMLELDKQFEAVARLARDMEPPTPPSIIVDITTLKEILRGDKK